MLNLLAGFLNSLRTSLPLDSRPVIPGWEHVVVCRVLGAARSSQDDAGLNRAHLPLSHRLL